MRDELSALAAFAAVAEERSFTRAAARLGVSQSALSHSVRELERKIALQLLARTSRSVAPTAVGNALLQDLRPALEQIERSLSDVQRLRDRPVGRLRLVMSKNAALMVLLPKLAAFTDAYPDVTLDVVTVSGPIDLVAGEFDAGIQIGETIQRDMMAVRVTRDLRLAIIGSPAYFRKFPLPKTPRDLQQHRCLGVRGATETYRWRFSRARKTVNVMVNGPLTIDEPSVVLQAAVDGIGLGIAFEEQITDHVVQGRLIRVLEDWCPPRPGFFLYYPSRRNQPATLIALIKTLRLH